MSLFNKLIRNKKVFMRIGIVGLMGMSLFGNMVNAQTTGSCNLSSSPLFFNSYSPFKMVDEYSSSTITVSCSNYVSTVVLKMNPNFITGDLLVRHMSNVSKSGSGKEYELSYSLFTNYERNIVWGNGLSNTDVLTVRVNDNKSGAVNFYGTLYKGQNVYSGIYSDTTTVEVEY